MARGKIIRFEVAGGLAQWSGADQTFAAGTHEVPASDRELVKALKDADAARVGVRILDGKE